MEYLWTNLTLFSGKFGHIFRQQQNEPAGFGTNFTKLINSQILESKNGAAIRICNEC